MGNCSYASPEMATKTMAMLEMIDKKHPAGLLENRESLNKTVSQISKDFEVMRYLARIESLRDYLKLFKSKDFPYKLDPFLVGKALALLWSSPTDNIELKKELQLVESEYFEIVKDKYEQDPLLDYKSEKVFQLSLKHGQKLSKNEATRTHWDKIVKAYDILITNYQLAQGKDPEMIAKMEKDFTNLVSDLNNIITIPVFKNYRLDRLEKKLDELIQSYTIK